MPPASKPTVAFKTAPAGHYPALDGTSTRADDEETVEVARSRSGVALPTTDESGAHLNSARPNQRRRCASGAGSSRTASAARSTLARTCRHTAVLATPRRRRRFDGEPASTSDGGCDRTGVSRKWKEEKQRAIAITPPSPCFFSSVFVWPPPHANPPSPGVSGRPQVYARHPQM